MRSKILVGAGAFMSQLAISSEQAKGSLYVQAMTFEGDEAGEQLIELMITCPAGDKRLMIDSFSKVVVSDHFVFGPYYLKEKAFRSEIANTRRLIKKARVNGIQVRFTNPVGFMMLKYPLRNHKKMMIVDEEVSYIGGINFSDHNFGWHDMMIEIEDRKIGKYLADDFRCTWIGENQSGSVDLKEASIYFFNGIKSKSLYDQFFAKIWNAKSSVHVISPYISDPLLTVLKRSAAKGVNVSIISPQQNNKSIFKNLLLSAFKKGYFKLHLYPGMSHLKAILIDRKTLIFGSSNYDLISYYFEQEVVIESKEPDLITAFESLILHPALDKSFNPEISDSSPLFAQMLMNGLKTFCRISSDTFLKPN